mmetsp:Transcript_17636/g.54919  ORF Transcript_17636/g.54919 Transcript_17636/m.54919 type:complete len:173 (+) Transcript_17636:205-723(+)
MAARVIPGAEGPTVSRASYVGKVSILYVLLFVDAVLNAVTDTSVSSLELVVFVAFLQVLLRFLSLMILFLLATSTLLFEAGMLDILLRQFANVITVSVVGMCIMLALRIYRILLLMRRRSLGTTSFFAFDGYFALFVIHNLGSVLYYHLSIAATFRLSDASFYDPRFWRRTA